MKPRIILSVTIIGLGLIIAAIPQNTTRKYKLSADQLLEEVQRGEQFISVDEVAKQLVEKNLSFQLIDVRPESEFVKNGLPGAINIPLNSLLDPKNDEILNQDVKMNVFYSNGNTHANEAWMITRQLGYQNNYVMLGGLNSWIETIVNPVAPASGSPDDEIAKYDFRKGAGQALYGAGAAVQAAQPASTPSKPGVPAVKKGKKKVSGGCS